MRVHPFHAPLRAGHRMLNHTGRDLEIAPTHTLEEMIQEAAKRHARQLEELIRSSGCMLCGADAVCIQYPPEWTAAIVGQGGVDTLQLEIRTRLRPLCAQCAGIGGEVVR